MNINDKIIWILLALALIVGVVYMYRGWNSEPEDISFFTDTSSVAAVDANEYVGALKQININCPYCCETVTVIAEVSYLEKWKHGCKEEKLHEKFTSIESRLEALEKRPHIKILDPNLCEGD